MILLVTTQMHDYSIFSFSVILSFIPFILIALALSSLTPRKTPSGSTRNPETNTRSIPSPNVVDQSNPPGEDNPTLTLVIESSPSDSENCTTTTLCFDDPNPVSESGQGGRKKKKRNGKKNKKKKKNVNSEGGGEEGEDARDEKRDVEVEVEVEREISGSELACFLSPFTSSSSAMQRKIKPQYDELIKCHVSKNLKLSQVVKFANSLVDARSELQHKADVIKRKFVITNALLCKADRSSVDRLRQQIYKLELEQKRLEEDAAVYNWLQHQLKLSPAYRKMLEIGISMEKEESCKLGDREEDAEFSDISFEELLAQEKKDSFWQKSGKSRQCSS